MSTYSERYEPVSEEEQIAKELQEVLFGDDLPVDTEGQHHLALVEFDDSEEVDLDDVPTVNESIEASASSSTQLFMNEIGKVALLTAAQEVELAKSMESGIQAKTLLANHKSMNYDENPRMQMVEERLERKIQDGKRAKDHMQEANLRLVVSIAKNYQGHGLSLMELISEGSLGLYRGVEKFDWRRGFKFSTYATWWIKQAVQRGLANHSRIVRLPVHVAERETKMKRAERELMARLGRPATNEEIVDHTGIELRHVKEVKEARLQVLGLVALDKPIGDEQEGRYGDMVADPHAEDPLERADEAHRTQVLHRALEQLPGRAIRILELRYGLAGGEKKTLEEIGKDLGITRERVRQIHDATLKKLKTLPEMQVFADSDEV